jgi:hypothetical protein
MIRYCTILFLLFAKTAPAQTAEQQFLVYHANKTIQWQHDGKTELATRGIFIKSKHSITVPEQGDVMLIKNDGRSLLISKPGSYSFQQIRSLFLKSKNNSAVSGFFAYVFEKFLAGSNGDDKQKVSAAVYRAKSPMKNPADSSFVFTAPVILEWVPEQKNLPYKISVSIAKTNMDTIIRGSTRFTIEAAAFDEKKGALIHWWCKPYNSKQDAVALFVFIVPSQKDKIIIQRQLKELERSSHGNPAIYRALKKDLFEKWLDFYTVN